MDTQLDESISPRPWSAVEIGRNSIDQPVMVVRDADGHAVAEYLSYGDAQLIVEAVNRGET